MNFRIAKKTDCKALASIHQECARNQVDGFMHRLGLPFLTAYYKVFIGEKHSLIIVAEENGKILGFHSGTLFAEEHHSALVSSKIRLGLAIIPSLLTDFGLLHEVFLRFKSLSTEEEDFRIKNGPRGEYWAWLPSNRDGTNALKLHKIWHCVLKDLGATFVRSEVDLSNDRVVRSIKLLGGKFISEITLADGRNRAIVEYEL